MFMSRTDNWGSVRQSFADQFEPDGTGFIYRRSQKGEAIRVSADERSRFIDEFDSNVRRAKWIIYVGLTVVLGGIILFSLLRGSDLSRLAMVAGFGIAMVPYFAFYRWAWLAPTRELEGRTPVAGERSPEEVRRLKFRRITYVQLATAAMAALAFPFMVSSKHENIFSGWNRLWLLFGGALLLFVAVQAFRKWQFEQEDSYRFAGAIPPRRGPALPSDDAGIQTRSPVARYVVLIAVALALPILLLTSAGKQFVRSPSFFPILMIGCGGWALFTVARGFTNGRIEPFIRGSYSTYEREAEPKRFWASMGWNGLFGGFCVWLAFQVNPQRSTPTVQDRCHNGSSASSLQEALKACDDWISSRPQDSEAYLSRGLIFLNNWKLDPAVADFSRAHELDPRSPWPIADRGISYAWKSDREHAESDFEAVRKLDPLNPVLLHGEAVLDMESGDLEDEIRQLNAGLARNPADAWSLQMRADAYQQRGDFEQARADRNALAKLRSAAVDGPVRS
jgi:Flp pilus assembly protein TadD